MYMEGCMSCVWVDFTAEVIMDKHNPYLLLDLNLGVYTNKSDWCYF